MSLLCRPAWSHIIYKSLVFLTGEYFYSHQHFYIYIRIHWVHLVLMYKTLWGLFCSLDCRVWSLKAEHLFVHAALVTLRAASALLQLYSSFHSNLRDWELKALWTFFNNERTLCFQCSSWLVHCGGCLQQFKSRYAPYFSSGHLHGVKYWIQNMKIFLSLKHK